MTDPRTCKDPTGRVWEVSLYYETTQAMAIPLDLPLDNLPANPANRRIRFRDPKDPTKPRSSPYPPTGVPLSQLTEKEILGYWELAR